VIIAVLLSVRLLRLFVIVALFALVAVCVSSTAVAASLRSYHYSDSLYAVGCESASQCVVTAHSAHPAGTRVLVIRNGKVLRAVTPKGTDSGNNTAVSCPSRRGCVAALPTADGRGLVVATVDGDGGIITKRVGAPIGVQFNSVSCVTLTACELAGAGNVALAIAPWNGKRRGPISYVNPPPPGHTYGEGNRLPTISCSASQCEAVFDYATDPLLHDTYEAFLVHLRHGKIDRSGWASGVAVSSLSCGTSRFCWALVTTSDGSSGPQLAQIDDGVLGTPGPLSVPAVGLACWSFTCAVVGDNQITTFISGHQTTVQTVSRALALEVAGAGPRGVFAGVGSAEPSGYGSVLAISH
jgi:hypothetical protein